MRTAGSQANGSDLSSSAGFRKDLAAACSNSLQGNIAMKNLLLHARQFLVSEDGPTAVEYAVMLALIIVVCLTAIAFLGEQASVTFSTIGQAIDDAN